MKFKRSAISLILVFGFLSVSVNLYSQIDSVRNIIDIKHLGIEDGLASREIFCSIQDEDGFLWFGTRNGLNRYDGKQFKLYTKQKDGLAENKIIQIAKDTKNRLILLYGHPGYARNVKAIQVFDLKTHKLLSLKEAYPNLPFDEEYTYWATNDGEDICFLTCQPFRYWRLHRNNFLLKCEMKAWDDSVASKEILKTKNGSYHTGTGRICIFKQEDAALYISDGLPIYLLSKHQVFEEKASSKNKGIITITPQHEFIIDENDRTYRLSYLNGWKKKQFQFYISPFTKASDVYVRHDNYLNLFCYTNEAGLYMYDYHSFQKIFSFQNLNKLEDRKLYEIYSDLQGNKWICTSDGLFKLQISKNPFIHYVTKLQLNDSSENQVRGIYVDDKKNVYTNVWTHTYKNNSRIASGLDDIKYSICQHRGDKITGSYTLSKLPEKKHLISTKISTHDFSEIWSMDSLNNEELLLGCTKNLFVYNVLTDSVRPIEYKNESIPKAAFTYRFKKRNNGTILAVSQNGLYLMDQNAREVLQYWGKNANSKKAGIALPFENILDAYEDANYIVWVATNGDGLYRCDIAKQHFQQFNIATGLPSDILYRIEPDEFNNLWISTDNGLAKFNMTNFKVKTYTTDNRISHNEFNRTSSFKAKDGMLLFGGLDGVNAFYPKDFVGDTTDVTLPLRIISYSKFSGDENKIIELTDNLLTQKKIDLEPGDRFFNLEFQLLDFQEGKLNYAYKVEGYDKDWNYISENSIRMSGLPYGDFQLHIKGQMHNGQWSNNELVIPVHIKAPIYKHTWFAFLAILSMIASFIWLFRWRTNRLVARKNALERTVALRTDQLKNSLAEKEVLLKEIHHRVKNNLQIIVSLLDMQQEKNRSAELQQSFLQAKANVRSISLIHENLYRHENLAGVELRNFIQELFEEVNTMFNTNGKDVSFNNQCAEIFLDIDTAVPFGLIVNELFTNSYKYAFPSVENLNINIQLGKNNDQHFEMIYHDNGHGLSMNFETAKTMGLTLIKDLSRQIGGRMKYSFDQGSVFKLEFLSLKARKEMD